MGMISFMKAIKEFKTVVSWQVFWNSKGGIHVDFLPHGVTINAQYYSNVLHSDVHHVIQKKWPGKLSKIILSHDNTGPVHIWKILQRQLWQQWTRKS
jgi:hypothetical protein